MICPQESQENFRQRSGRSRFGWNNQSQGQASDPGDHNGYYKALEVKPNASQQEISAAYRYFSKLFRMALHLCCRIVQQIRVFLMFCHALDHESHEY